MDWLSEASVLWLPVPKKPERGDFPQAGGPEVSGFFYYALDAFADIKERRATESALEPWVYVLDTDAILSPAEIDQLMDEFDLEYAARNAADEHPS